MPADIMLSTAAGDFAAIDHGGTGPGVLLLHDAMENAASWNAVCARMPGARCVAVDLDGHGATSDLGLSVRDHASALAEIVAATGMDRPLLVGEGIGGWLAVAATILGTITPSALILVESAYLGDEEELTAYVGEFGSAEMRSFVERRYQLGARVAGGARAEFIERFVASGEDDWAFQDRDPEVMRAVISRALVAAGSTLLRRPTPDAAVRAMTWTAQEPLPSTGAYDTIDVPVHFVMADKGMYGYSPDLLDTFVAGHADRRLTVVPEVLGLSAAAPQIIAQVAEQLFPVSSVR